MEPKITAGINEHFSELQDPWLERSRLPQLIDILVIAICAVICGADTWEDVEAFGKAKQTWFAGFLELPNGIPSHDTFNRLNPEQFQRCFLQWGGAVRERIEGPVIAIDGKLW